MLTPIACTLEGLARGELRSSELVDACLYAIADAAGEGERTFTRTFDHAARAAAKKFDTDRTAVPLAGLPVSVKDLFDVAGQPTTAGSLVLAGAPKANTDALAVARLRAAGAILIGHTNMTEFAFSGLGLNPHHGTPCNPYDRIGRRIPGGSSSGAAVSVTDGMAHAAIGSDTGGSVRIPAALCGLTGFKPTARRVPLDGTLPLSFTLDSAGPIAPTVACCALIDSVLAGLDPQPLPPVDLAHLRLGVLQGYVLDGMDASVSAAFSFAIALLSRLGAQVEDITLPSLDKIPVANQKGGFAAAESYSWHRSFLEKDASRYDPRVLSRILRGREITAADHRDLSQTRYEIIVDAAHTLAGFDAILMPTVPRIAPRIADLEADDAVYFEANAAMLRNPSVWNFLDGCALSIPCHLPGEAPVGLMVAGLAMQDGRVLSIGAAIESALAAEGRAIHELHTGRRSTTVV
ncbi:MAG: amidase [Acidobacteriaceae bacterium]|jgi:aspartyl-tRNA(Asn)/glutamyl-tRNA(Gln) amidotransferase subunit A